MLALSCLVLAAGCSSPSARAASQATGTTSTSTTTSTVIGGFVSPEIKFGTGGSGPADPTTTVPVERTGRPIDPSNDAGQAVIIDQSGYLLPEWLVADVDLPITWTNLSGKTQQIVFDDAPVHSALIPPGGSFSWKSPGFAINLTYHTANGHHARLTLQNPNDNT